MINIMYFCKIQLKSMRQLKLNLYKIDNFQSDKENFIHQDRLTKHK